jgi:hypothetical protein
VHDLSGFFHRSTAGTTSTSAGVEGVLDFLLVRIAMRTPGTALA